MLKKLRAHSHLLHKTGMFLSILCLVHCLATPFVITALPFIAKEYISHTTEVVLIFSSLIIASFIFKRDFGIHHNYSPIILLLLGVSIQFLGIYGVSHKLETTFLLIGSLFVATAYYKNWKLHRKTCNNHTH